MVKVIKPKKSSEFLSPLGYKKIKFYFYKQRLI